MKIALSNENWALLKDPAEVTNGERKAALRAYDASPGGMVGLAKDFATFDALLAAMILEWSFETPLPRTDLGSLESLSMADANLLYDALRPLISQIFPDFTPSPDPKVHTEESSG